MVKECICGLVECHRFKEGTVTGTYAQGTMVNTWLQPVNAHQVIMEVQQVAPHQGTGVAFIRIPTKKSSKDIVRKFLPMVSSIPLSNNCDTAAQAEQPAKYCD